MIERLRDAPAASALVEELGLPTSVGADGAVEILASIGRVLLGSQHARTYPALAVLGFWLRGANLRPRLDALAGYRRPRGCVFHVAPANVEVMFAYSWAAAFASGNASVVRVSSRASTQTELLVQVIADALSGSGLAGSNRFVSYPNDEVEITKILSASADVRMLWGGDQSVLAVRALPSKLTGKDLVFADKKSASLLAASAIVAMDEPELTALAGLFLRDIMTFDQMACSSPRALIWLGDERTASEARQSWWAAIERLTAEKYHDSTMVEIDKLVQLFIDASAPDHQLDARQLRAPVKHVELVDPLPLDARQAPGGGYVYELRIESLDQLQLVLHDRLQTLGYAGLDGKRIADTVLAGQKPAPDRIVPVGSALDFDLIWDGYDLLEELTRRVDVK